MHKHGKPGASQRGVTLIELLVAMLILAIVGQVLVVTFKSYMRTYLTQKAVIRVQQDLRAALYYMEYELRRTGFDPLMTGDEKIGIETMEGDKILVGYAWDNEKNGLSRNDIQKLQYSIGEKNGGPALKRTTWSYTPTKSNPGPYPRYMIENVDSLAFTYLDQENNVTSAPENVESILITLSATPRYPEEGARVLTLSGRVALRNLGL